MQQHRRGGRARLGWAEHWSADPSALRDSIFKRWRSGQLGGRFWHCQQSGSSTYWPPTDAVRAQCLAEHAHSCAVKELWRAGEAGEDGRVHDAVERGVCVRWDMENRRCLGCTLAAGGTGGVAIFAKAGVDDVRLGQAPPLRGLTLMQRLLLPDASNFAVDRPRLIQTARVVQLLLSLGARAFGPVLHGAIHLDAALEKAHVQGGTVPLLLGAGPDLEQRDAQQQTALHVACAAASTVTVRALLKRGAGMHAKDNKGRIALQLIPSPAGELREMLGSFMRRVKESAMQSRNKTSAALASLLLKGPSQWSCSDVSKWLRLDGHKDLARCFAAARVDGKNLASFMTNELAAFRTLPTFQGVAMEWTDDATEERCDAVQQVKVVLQKLPRLFAFFDDGGAEQAGSKKALRVQRQRQLAAAERSSAKKAEALLKTRSQEIAELEQLARATTQVRNAGDDTSELERSIAWALSSCRESVVTHERRRSAALVKATRALQPTTTLVPGAGNNRPASAKSARARPQSAAASRQPRARSTVRPKSAVHRPEKKFV